MPPTLDEIVAYKRHWLENRRQKQPDVFADARPELATGRFAKALQGDGIRLITEIKPKSPSAGVLQAELNLEGLLAAYNSYASAISVLTDQKFFNGSHELLAQVSAQSPHPTLCKDFVLETSQVIEARLSGAEAVLLIVKILDDETLRQLFDAITELGMTPLVEIQNGIELERALKLPGPLALLINNRDLTTFEIDLDTTAQLAPLIPKEHTVISASGIHTRADIERLLPCCARFLIGTSLMQSPDPAATLRQLLGEEAQG